MKQSKNNHRIKIISAQLENKSLQNQKAVKKTEATNIPETKTTATDNTEKPNNQILSDTNVKEIANNSSKINDKHNDTKQCVKKKAKVQYSEQLNNILLGTYQLNVNNYVTELHNALVKECEYNLLDPNLLDAVLDIDTLSNVTNRTFKAIKDQKVFSVLGYFPKVAEELKNRGWIQKLDPFRPSINYSYFLKSSPNMVHWMESPPLIKPTTEKDVVWERLKNAHSWSILKDRPSDLIFVARKRLVNWNTLNEITKVSQMAKHAFCTKNGLAQCLEPYKNVVTNLMFPRCHYIRNNTDYDAFMEDYITTALIGTLKIIVQSIEKNKIIFSVNGNVPYKVIHFVERCVFKFLKKIQTGSLKSDTWKYESQKDVWNEFMKHYMTLIFDENAAFRHQYNTQFELDVYAKYKYLIDNIKAYCPQYYIDGNTNTWIIKPISNCSGHGIIMSRDLKKIKEKITEGSRTNHILQKYIEKPLLVYMCKIDLRQWFLVTNMSPVVVWMYKEGYVRFCANTFSMKNLHESIHLSNVRLQKKYRKIRSSQVPEECMWDYKELQNHLASIGQEHVWDELIFPGMSESIYAVLMAAKETSIYRVKTFQLFGADFVITENYVPYLIEINSIPGLNPTTCVIANLAPMLLADIVKVVVDYEENANADTGLFVKIAPEEPKVTSTEPLYWIGRTKVAPVIRSGTLNRQNEQSSDYADRHQWVENVNNNLDAIRYQINSRPKPTDRYLGPNRDNLLMMATMSSDTDVTTTKNVTVDREAVLKNSLLLRKIVKLKTLQHQIPKNSDRRNQPEDPRRR